MEKQENLTLNWLRDRRVKYQYLPNLVSENREEILAFIDLAIVLYVELGIKTEKDIRHGNDSKHEKD